MTRALSAQISYKKLKSLAELSSNEGAALVVGVASDGDKIAPTKLAKGQKATDAFFKFFSSFPAFKGKTESIVSFLHNDQCFGSLASKQKPAHLVAFGVGQTKNFYSQNILSWGGRLAQEIKKQEFKNVDIWIDSFFNPAPSARDKNAPKDFAGRPHIGGIPTLEAFVEKFAMGLYLGFYSFDVYKSSLKRKDAPAKIIPHITFHSTTLDAKKVAKILDEVRVVAEGVYFTRDLQTTPGGDLQPADLAREATNFGKKCGFHVTVWDEKKLKTEGMNGILAVGQGSSAPPRFIIMEHNASKKNLPKLVLIGKGITFDTGGISIKPAVGMEEMKMDMSGSAAVIGAMGILSQLKIPLRVVGLVASAENMPSGNATRPGDIYTAYDGQTVEVLNTDAEGRLVLADAIAYAKTLDPDCVIDMATLTGAVLIALGFVSTGLMGNNAALIEGFTRASETAGERVWELPLYSEYGEDMRSKIADYQNIGTDKTAGSQKGGAFLNFFVKDAFPWIHLDIAGTADTPKGQGNHCPPNVGTGVPVRSLIEFAKNYSTYFKGVKK